MIALMSDSELIQGAFSFFFDACMVLAFVFIMLKLINNHVQCKQLGSLRIEAVKAIANSDEVVYLGMSDTRLWFAIYKGRAIEPTTFSIDKTMTISQFHQVVTAYRDNRIEDEN